MGTWESQRAGWVMENPMENPTRMIGGSPMTLELRKAPVLEFWKYLDLDLDDIQSRPHDSFSVTGMMVFGFMESSLNCCTSDISRLENYSGWWFGTFFFFPNSWDDDPI